jgi:hypothetical protein
MSSLLVFVSCKDKMVCAAFQSTYILDPQKQNERFSYFKNDSLLLTAETHTHKKDIYGLSVRKYGFWKQQELLMVDQIDVYSDEIDSLLALRSQKPSERAEFDIDSISSPQLDSLQLAEGEDAWDNTKRFNYNVDMVKYMELVGNDILRAQAAQRDSSEAKKNREVPVSIDSTQNDGGFIKSIFGGQKNKEKKKNRTELKTKEQEAALKEQEEAEQE